MILLFAIAASLCLQGFVVARNISDESIMRDRSVSAVQNAAEMIKYHNGNFADAALDLGGESTDEEWIIYYDSEWTCVLNEGDSEFILHAQKTDSGVENLGKALITLFHGEEEIYSVNVGWQKGEMQ